MPGTLVAVAQGAPVGAVCLVEHDMPGHEAVAGMSPWIKGLYVDQPARRHGYGALLVSRCETWAAALGHHALYLYTERGSAAEQPYKRLGWRIIRYERYDGMDVTVMRKNLSPVPPAGPAKITLACKRRQKGVLICRIDGRQAC